MNFDVSPELKLVNFLNFSNFIFSHFETTLICWENKCWQKNCVLISIDFFYLKYKKMGAGSLQQTADTEKHTSLHEGKDLTFAVSHMCGMTLFTLGWRQFMEDAHLAVSPLSD
jgi:hypothetical protein